MRAVAQEEIQRAIPQIYQQAYNDALNDLLAALRVDVESIVSIGLANAGEIFYGKRCQAALLNAVLDEIEKNLATRGGYGR